jgi:hypothetical protein
MTDIIKMIDEVMGRHGGGPRIQVTDIPEADGLDHIIVYWHDVAPGKGHVTIICWGCAWTSYFGGMGKHNIQSFFASADVGYLVGKMGSTQWLKASKKHDLYLGKVIGAVQASIKAAGGAS